MEKQSKSKSIFDYPTEVKLLATGGEINFAMPGANKFDIKQTFLLLQNIKRFNGIGKDVLKHSEMVMILAIEYTGNYRLGLLGLLHDVPEAYMGDVAPAVKATIPMFGTVEQDFFNAMWEQFTKGLPLPTKEEWAFITLLDKLVLEKEVALLQEEGYFKDTELTITFPTLFDKHTDEPPFSVDAAVDTIRMWSDIVREKGISQYEAQYCAYHLNDKVLVETHLVDLFLAEIPYIAECVYRKMDMVEDSLTHHGITPPTNEQCQAKSGGVNSTPFDKQVGGDHYKKYPIQPLEFIMKNNLGFCEGNVIKYVLRHKNKNGVEDLEKAKHYIEMLINQTTQGA